MPIYKLDIVDGKELVTTVKTLPDLRDAVRICVDTETYDPNIKTTGPSVRTGGYIAGVGVGAEFENGEVDGWYLPVEHLGYEEECLDKKEIMGWLRELLSRTDREVVFANAMYDLDYLSTQEGVEVKGKIIDVLLAAPLIDENASSYSLESVAGDLLGEGKDGEGLYEYCAEHFGGRATRAQQAKNIYRCPPKVVATYGVGDVTLPLRVWSEQRKIITFQGLWGVFDLEASLVPMLLAMRQRGVRVDIGGVDKVQAETAEKMITLQKKIDEMAGKPIAVYEPSCLLEAYTKLDLPFARTEKGNPSFAAAVLERSEFGRMINQLKQATKIHDVFLESYINNFVIRDRIHPNFNQLKGDDSGTVTGRFSSSQPNLQNIPRESAMRSLYIPEDGEQWYKLDYNSVEYRLALHYAKGAAADSMRGFYEEDPLFDAHQMTADDIGITRTQAKAINFGLIYGMGVAKLSAELGVSPAEGKKILYRFHDKVPFMKELLNKAMKRASDKGYVHTLAGRRRRFELFEPARWTKGAFPKPRTEALHEYGPSIKRAMTYKALNAIVQGGAADIMKKAMVDVYQSGVCDVIGLPMLTVHDELDFSANDGPAHQEALREVSNLMENAFQLSVPLIVDAECGKDWGSVKKVIL